MTITIETDSLLSVAQTAKALNKPRFTIYRWIESGKIKAIKLGGVLFVPKEEVERVKVQG